jgi:hypothetical protein
VEQRVVFGADLRGVADADGPVGVVHVLEAAVAAAASERLDGAG